MAAGAILRSAAASVNRASSSLGAAMISQSRIDEATTAKDAIGWSWMTVQARLGWSVHHLNQVKALKRPIADAHLTYLKGVAAAVTAIPIPEPEPVMPENLRVMLLDDIAAKLADAYFTIPDTASRIEVEAARWMIGELAQRMSVAEDLKQIIADRKAAAETIAMIAATPVAGHPFQPQAFAARLGLERVPMTE